MSDTELDTNQAYAHEYEHDHAPGDLPEESAGHWIFNYVIGLVLATVLTAMSFGVAAAYSTPHFLWGPSIPVALIVLAIAQMGVHLVFFLHITTGPDNTNNVLALAFGILIVFLVVGGSIWIMGHLNGRTMVPPTMGQAMQMQQ